MFGTILEYFRNNLEVAKARIMKLAKYHLQISLQTMCENCQNWLRIFVDINKKSVAIANLAMHNKSERWTAKKQSRPYNKWKVFKSSSIFLSITFYLSVCMLTVLGHVYDVTKPCVSGFDSRKSRNGWKIVNILHNAIKIGVTKVFGTLSIPMFIEINLHFS